MARYTIQETQQILAAYRWLFPSVEGELSGYWDFGRTRDWSVLTTNFHKATPEAIMAFDEAVREATSKKLTPEELGMRLRELALAHGTGYSLGISPWTDDLLLRTFNEKTKEVVIVLGHDWYPIVTSNLIYKAATPLDRFSVYDEPAYGSAIPKVDAAVLFMNLYPDFRPPAVDVMGALGDYNPWVKGFGAVCESISKNYTVKAIISWGAPVWEALQKNVDPAWRKYSIMQVVPKLYETGRPMNLCLGGVSLPYYPFAHPSFAPNFRRQAHLEAYQGTCERLARGFLPHIAANIKE